MRHHPNHEEERGTLRAYIIGFILSVILTLVPYRLVHNHSGVSKTLLLTILGLGVVQMIIQVIFFLDLGRGPKPRWELYFFISTVSMIIVVVGASLVIITNLHSNMTVPNQEKKIINDEAIYQVNGKLTGACQETHRNYQVTFSNDTLTPRQTTADKCDTLTFINNDSYSHEIAFGTHPAHTPYAGDSEINLRPGKTKTITLSEVGGFNFHDHLRPYLVGSFLVLNNTKGL